MGISKSLANGATIVALVGAMYAVYGAVTFKPVPAYSGFLEMCEPDYSNWFDFVEFAKKNDGDIVLLDVRVLYDVDTCNTDEFFRVQETEGSTESATYYLSPIVSQSLSDNELDRAYSNGLLADNGTAIIFNKSDTAAFNPLTRIGFFNEGLEDRYSGPLQVRFGGADAAMWVEFDTPIVSDRLAQRIACTERGWGILRRSIVCPTL